MKLRRILTTLSVICLSGAMMFPTNAFAYDKQTYEFDAEGNYLVDNAAKRTTDNRITLNVLVPKKAVLEGSFYYQFKCTSNNFKDSDNFNSLGYGSLAYKSRFETCTELDKEIGTGVLVAFKFNIENGTYVFSTNDSTSIVTLSPDYKNPMDIPINYSSPQTAMASIKEYPVTLNNESLNLYAIYGDIEFINANATALANYATGRGDTSGVSTSNDAQKSEIASSLSGFANSQNDEDIKALSSELLQDNLNVSIPDEDIGEVSVSGEGVNITTSVQEKEVEPQKKTFDLKNTLIIVIGLVFFFGVIKLIRNKKK